MDIDLEIAYIDYDYIVSVSHLSLMMSYHEMITKLSQKDHNLIIFIPHMTAPKNTRSA